MKELKMFFRWNKIRKIFYLKAIAHPQWSRQNGGDSLLKVEEALQSSKTEYRGRWRRGRLEQSSKTSAVAGGVDK